MNYKRRSRKNENWISYKVNQELKVEKSSFYKNLKTFILEMSIPSNKSFILILVLSITIILLIHIERVFSILQINDYIVLRNSTFLQHQIDNQDLLTALAGISSIIFGLIIFISGQKDEYVKRILLRESYLYPLSVTTILFFLIFIFGDVNILGFFPILIIGLLTVNATAKILLHYLNEKKFTEKKKYLLKNDLVESIKLEMKKIIAKKHIISNPYLDVIQYESRSKYNKDTSVSSKKSGIIVDINIKKLDQIIANKTSNQKPKLEIRNLFDVITPEENILLKGRDYKDTNVMFTKKDEKIIESAFEIKPLSPFYKDFDIRIFQFLQMPYIKAIQNKVFFEIENFRELHIELIEYISQTIISIKNISDKDKDKDKDYEIFLKLFKDLNEALFREALLSHDKLIFNKVIQNSLIRNLIFSVNNKDKYLFNLFMDSIKYMFDFAYDIRIQREFKEFIHEQLLSYMKTDIAAIVEFSNGDLSDFFSEYCEIFKLIWKKAFDERDTKTFKEIVEKIFKNEIDAENFREKYQVMIFELISWNLYKFLNDKKKDVKLKEYYEYFQKFIDNLGILPKEEESLVENLTKIYVSIYKNIEKETLLPIWYLYEKGIDDGLHAYEEEILDNITIFYIITLILNSYNVNETSKSYFKAEEHSDIQKRIEEIFNKISNSTNISKPYFIVKKYLQSKGVDI